MKSYSQNDPAWKGIRMGKCPDTIGQSGCTITCLGMMLEVTPDQMNKRDIYVKDNCIVDWNKAAAMGMVYDGTRDRRVMDYPIIGCTDHYLPKVPQHFFVMLNDSDIIDPLDGKTKNNPYKIISYRNIHPAQEDDMALIENLRKGIISSYRVDGTGEVSVAIKIGSEADYKGLTGHGVESAVIRRIPSLTEDENRNPVRISDVLWTNDAQTEALENEVIDLKGEVAEVSTERDLANNLVSALRSDLAKADEDLADANSAKKVAEDEALVSKHTAEVLQEKLAACQGQTGGTQPVEPVSLLDIIINFIRKLFGR